MMHLLKRLLLWFALCVLAAGAAIYYYAHDELALPQAPVTFELRAGSSLRTVATQLSAAGVIGRPEPFEMLARLLGESARLKAGNYEFSWPMTPLGLLRRMTRGDVTLVAVTFVEGWTFNQMRKALQDNPKVRTELAGLPESEVLQRLGISAPSAEGWFFPDTYHFSEGASDLAILRRAHQLMRSHLEQEWSRREEKLPPALAERLSLEI